MAAPNILCDTAGMTNAQWLAARMHGPSGKIPYTLTAEMVDAFIDEMILYNNGHVEVKFNFRNELDEVIHLAAIRQREVERYAM